MKFACGSPERPECAVCGLFKRAQRPFIPPTCEDPDHAPDLALVGEAPGPEEDQQGEYFVGRTGKLLDNILDASRWRDSGVAFLNAVQCFPGLENGEIAKPTMDQVRCCRPLLLENLKHLRAPVTVALGQWAIRALTDDGVATVGGKRPRRLRDLEIPGLEVQPAVVTASYHPAWVLRGNPQGETIIREDLDRAWDMESPPVTAEDIPEVMPLSPAMLSRYARRWVSLDTEYGPEGALYSVALYDGETLYAGLVDRAEAEASRGEWMAGLQALMDQAHLLGHQVRADVLSLARAGVRLPEFQRVECSLAAARMVWENDPDRSLETLAVAKLGLPDYAAEIAPWKRKHPQDFGAHAPADILLRYNATDAYASWVLMEFLRPHLPQALWVLLMEAEWNLLLATWDGQHVDKAQFGALCRKYRGKVGAALGSLRRLTKIKDYNPRDDAGKAFPWAVLKWKPLKQGKDGPSLDEEVLLHYKAEGKPQDKAFASALLDYRYAVNRYDRLRKNFGDNRDERGLIHAQFNTAMARTMRDSSSGKARDLNTAGKTGVNFQNVTPELRAMFTSRWR